MRYEIAHEEERGSLVSLLGSLIRAREYVRLRTMDGDAPLEVMPLYINLQPVQLTNTHC